jgi:polyferredoxin
MKPQGSKTTVKDWLWWLLWGLIIAACVSYPIRWFFWRELYGKLSILQEILLFLVTVFGLAFFVVRPFCRGMDDEYK